MPCCSCWAAYWTWRRRSGAFQHDHAVEPRHRIMPSACWRDPICRLRRRPSDDRTGRARDLAVLRGPMHCAGAGHLHPVDFAVAAAPAVVVIPSGIAAASYLPDSADSRNSWLIFRYKLQPSQNCRIISVASLRPPTMHIRLSDRHAGKAAEAPVVPGRGFSARASGAPCAQSGGSITGSVGGSNLAEGVEGVSIDVRARKRA